MRHVAVRLPPPLIEAIDSVAVHHRCRPSAVMRYVLETGVTALIEQIPPRRF